MSDSPDTWKHAHDSRHGHVGGHHSHGHSHAAHVSARRLLIALLILMVFTLVEAIGGYRAHSIALLAESAHMLTDSASILLAIMAIRLGERPPDGQRTYGHRRYQPLAAFVNGQVLLLLTAWVIFEAIHRVLQPATVNGRLMLVVALIGGLANLAAFICLSNGHSLNERGARAHVLSDLLGSGIASVAALLIQTERWSLADPILSLLVSALILRSAWSLTRESAEVLLEGAPRGFDARRIQTELLDQVPGLIGVHHIHVWSMTGERPTVTLHAQVCAGTRHDDIITAIHTRLGQRLNVEHTTIQIEEDGPCANADCGAPLQRL